MWNDIRKKSTLETKNAPSKFESMQGISQFTLAFSLQRIYSRIKRKLPN